MGKDIRTPNNNKTEGIREDSVDTHTEEIATLGIGETFTVEDGYGKQNITINSVGTISGKDYVQFCNFIAMTLRLPAVPNEISDRVLLIEYTCDNISSTSASKGFTAVGLSVKDIFGKEVRAIPGSYLNNIPRVEIGKSGKGTTAYYFNSDFDYAEIYYKCLGAEEPIVMIEAKWTGNTDKFKRIT
jgi:hypothetical protein